MTTNERLIEYIRSITNGLINLSAKHVIEIKNIVENNPWHYHIKFYRYNDCMEKWQFVFQQETKAFDTYDLQFVEVDKFYKYELYEDQKLVRVITTVRTNLFE